MRSTRSSSSPPRSHAVGTTGTGVASCCRYPSVCSTARPDRVKQTSGGYRRGTASSRERVEMVDVSSTVIAERPSWELRPVDGLVVQAAKGVGAEAGVGEPPAAVPRRHPLRAWSGSHDRNAHVATLAHADERAASQRDQSPESSSGACRPVQTLSDPARPEAGRGSLSEGAGLLRLGGGDLLRADRDRPALAITTALTTMASAPSAITQRSVVVQEHRHHSRCDQQPGRLHPDQAADRRANGSPTVSPMTASPAFAAVVAVPTYFFAC